jgi:hypothetical protein
MYPPLEAAAFGFADARAAYVKASHAEDGEAA